MTKKILPIFFLIAGFNSLQAQQTSTNVQAQNNSLKIDLSNRANDHFMIQYGLDGWAGTNDTTRPKGFSRHFNFYLMYDIPFKTNPHFSVGLGVGLGTSNMFFQGSYYINLKSPTTTLPFAIDSTADRFAKYKLTTAFLEAPLELRYVTNPAQPDRGFKIALGAKIGTLLKAYTKGKNYETYTGGTIYGNTYIQKEEDRRFINTTKFAITLRVGYGFISIDGSYQLTTFLKENTGPVINPYSIGLTLSGL